MAGLFSLTTDLGYKDNYLALLKAFILKQSPGVTLIDISHDIEKFNILQAAYLFGSAYHHFPENTIHILGIKADYSENDRFLLIEYSGHKILCPDNGIFSLFGDFSEAKVYAINNLLHKQSVFFVRDVLASTACLLEAGEPIEELALLTDDYKQLLAYQPTMSGQTITGRCIYMDSYGNVITNIKKDFFEHNRKGRKFAIHLPSIRITEISADYDAVPETNALALFNSSGNLEIAINKGPARQLLFPKNAAVHNDFNITIEFEE